MIFAYFFPPNSMYYDAMICKLTTYGKDRMEAINRSVQALDRYVIRGVSHNIALLRDILLEKKFLQGDLTTNYLPETYPEGFLVRPQQCTFSSR